MIYIRAYACMDVQDFSQKPSLLAYPAKHVLVMSIGRGRGFTKCFLSPPGRTIAQRQFATWHADKV